MAKKQKDPYKTIARNKKAAHDYILEDRLEAGIVLRGTEIKSARSGNVSLKEAYIQISDGAGNSYCTEGKYYA
jgi:SsrA-binding protein